jgi:hypothetical protein
VDLTEVLTHNSNPLRIMAITKLSKPRQDRSTASVARRRCLKAKNQSSSEIFALTLHPDNISTTQTPKLTTCVGNNYGVDKAITHKLDIEVFIRINFGIGMAL